MDNQEQKESRKYKRFPFIEDILIDNTTRGNSNDISENGMFICTDHPSKENSVIDVTIPLKITLKAVVEHCQPEIGMGIQFIDLTDNQRLMIKQLIEVLKIESDKTQSQEKQILIIEDNDIMRKLYKTKLIADGFSVIEARDGVEGISVLVENTPDIIVLDLYMKRMDGFKVLSIIKSSPKWANISVLVFSALITQDVIDKLISGGADDFLVKQVTSPFELSDAVKALLQRKKN